MTPTPVFPQTPKNYKVQIANADGQTAKTVATGGSNGTKIVSLNLSSTDTSARDIQIVITRSGTSYILGTVSVPIGAGNTSGAAAVDALRSGQVPGLPLDSDGNPFIFLADASDTLQVIAPVTITSAKIVSAVAMGADF